MPLKIEKIELGVCDHCNQPATVMRQTRDHFAVFDNDVVTRHPVMGDDTVIRLCPLHARRYD